MKLSQICLWLIIPFLLSLIISLCLFLFSSTEYLSGTTYDRYLETLQNVSQKKAKRFPIMSYNIRWSDLNNKEDTGFYSWKQRGPKVIETINKFSPYILGTQEGLQLQMDNLLSSLPQYKSIGFCRIALLYQPKYVQLLDSGEFWIEKNPDMRELHGWSRRATWGKFRLISPILMTSISQTKKKEK